MGYYEEKTEISYYAVNSSLCLKPASLATLFQDLAIRHSDSLGYTIEYLSQKQRGWAITNWHIEVIRYPKCGEQVTLRTWASSTKRILAERSYIVLDSHGEEIIKANSRWVFMDLEKRKPDSVPGEMQERYFSGLGPAIEKERYRLPAAEEDSFENDMEFTVKRSETDTNGHANNVQYIAWAMDSVPDEIYYSRYAFDIRVVYRKECYRNSLVKARTFVKDTEDGKEVITNFYDGNDSGIVFCEVATLWRRNGQ